MDRKYKTWLNCMPLKSECQRNEKGIYYLKNRQKCWAVDILQKKVRYKKNFYTKEEAISWRNSLDLNL